MLLSNTRLAVKPSNFDLDEINIHSITTQHYGRLIALRGRLVALGFTPLFTRVERLSAGLTLTVGASAVGMGAAGMEAAGMGAAGTVPIGMGATGMCAGGGMGVLRHANSHRPTQPELTPIRVLWVGLSRCFSCRRFLCGSSQWWPSRQKVISTECPLLPAREWFDFIHTYAGVGTCGHDVQFRTPSVLGLAHAGDTVSQVNQVTNV